MVQHDCTAGTAMANVLDVRIAIVQGSVYKLKSSICTVVFQKAYTRAISVLHGVVARANRG